MNQHVTFAKQDHRPWEAVEYEILCKMAHAGKNDDEIGAMLGRPRGTVRSARIRLGIASSEPRDSWTKDELNTVSAMFHAGRSDQQIGEVLGRSRWAVIHKRRELGVDTNSRKGEPLPSSTAPRVLAANLFYQRPCPINAEYEERVRANAAYLISAMRAGHPVYAKGRGAE